MSHYRDYENRLRPINNPRDQPVLIAFDIEDGVSAYQVS
jgi:hypothetical protein